MCALCTAYMYIEWLLLHLSNSIFLYTEKLCWDGKKWFQWLLANLYKFSGCVLDSQDVLLLPGKNWLCCVEFINLHNLKAVIFCKQKHFHMKNVCSAEQNLCIEIWQYFKQTLRNQTYVYNLYMSWQFHILNSICSCIRTVWSEVSTLVFASSDIQKTSYTLYTYYRIHMVWYAWKTHVPTITGLGMGWLHQPIWK